MNRFVFPTFLFSFLFFIFFFKFLMCMLLSWLEMKWLASGEVFFWFVFSIFQVCHIYTCMAGVLIVQRWNELVFTENNSLN